MPRGYDAHPSNLSRVVTIARMDPGLQAHAREVADLAGAVARALGLDRRGRGNVARAAELHDIGKLAMPAEILAKDGPLDPVEHALLRRHTLVGEAMIGAAPALRPVALLVRASHERWDGRGYPDGLEGRGDPARRAHRRGVRRVQRHVRAPPLRPRAVGGRGARRTAAVLRHAVRPAGDRGVLRDAGSAASRGLTVCLR